MRRVLKVFKWLCLIMLVLLILAGTGGYLYLRSSLPQTEGQLSVSGSSAPIEIIRDIDGVPHIYAQTRQDALFGLGYVHAQDRLWQMEIARRTAQGRFAEIFGPPGLDTDRYLRTLGLYRAAESAWQRLPQADKELIDAYSAGINAFLAAHSGSSLPPEFSLLGVSPEPWQSIDSLAVIKVFALEFSGNYSTEMLHNYLLQRFDATRARELLPNYPSDGATTVGQALLPAPLEALPGFNDPLQAALLLGPAYSGAKGSNGWVVSGAKSTTGKPVLANDPHIGSLFPGWYIAHLSASEFDVIGATMPGLPGIVIGHNDRIAWGITSLNPDVQDLYLERIDPSGRMVEYQGQMEPLQVLSETLKVKGQPDHQLVIQRTRHGPLFSELINQAYQQLPEDLRSGQTLPPMALRWSALEAEDTTVTAFMALNQARTWSEAQQALAKLGAPALNVIYADVEGNIGYYATGKIPIRAAGAGSLPLEGWSGSYEWQGWVPFEQLPHAYNPAGQLITSANNRPAPADYPFYLGEDWAPPYRAQRITDLLKDKPALSLDDHAAIQNDTVSLQARELLPLLLAMVRPQNEQERQALALLAGWDGDVRADSAAAALYEFWMISLRRAIVGDELAVKTWVIRYEEDYTFSSRFLANTLSDPHSRWCDDVATAEQEDCRAIAARAFTNALQQLINKLGDDPSSWRWDALHSAVLYHVPFDNIPILKSLFSREVATGGDWSTVNTGAYLPNLPMQGGRFERSFDFDQRLVATYRQIIDLANPDASRFIVSGGQSGHFLSSHYDDQLEDWAAGRYRQLRFSRALVEQDKQAVLRLVPQ